jgi:hypothetical protein
VSYEDQEDRMSALIRLVVLILFVASSLHAQALNSGSDGTDGALTLTSPGEVIFDPVAMGLDTDRDNVFHFTTITIGVGVIVKMPFNRLQGAPVIWLASGAVQIDGTIDLNGQRGADATSGLLTRLSVPGPGGYPGGPGAGGPGFNTAPRGFGPGAGPLSAGHAFPTHQAVFAPAYGNALLVPLRGGSGGSGGGTFSTPGGSGGAGGGALRIFSSTSIGVNGAITVDGGDGGGAGDSGGGGGSGGSIHLIALTISGTGTLSAAGGRYNQFNGLFDASVGRVRLDAPSNQFSGVSNALLTRGTPYNVPLPAGMPSVRVTSIAGIAIAPSPTGETAAPDATINQSGPVAVTIEAKNIPPGTVVQLRILSEAVQYFVVNAAPLQGTLEFSTATASVTFPPGFSRGLVRATWNPPPQ